MASSVEKRSDLIRKRRKNSLQKGKIGADRRKKSISPQSPPPVMARNPSNNFPQRERQGAKKTRRRYDLALGTQGAELRLPSLPQVRVGWRFVSLLLLGFFSYGLYLMWNMPEFRIDSVQIAGLERVSVSAVNAVLGIEGVPVFTLDAGDLVRKLRDEFPEFSTVEVTISLPDSVLVKVNERNPVLIWQQHDRTFLVDGDGMTFPLRADLSAYPLPVVQANTDPPSPQEFDQILSEDGSESGISEGQLLEIVQSNQFVSKTLLTKEMVRSILLLTESAPNEAILNYDSDHGLVWKDKRGWDVYFGSPENVEMKLRVYKAILEHLKSQDTRPMMISVEFLEAPYYRLAG